MLSILLVSCGGGGKDEKAEKGAVWGIGSDGLATLLVEHPDTPMIDLRTAEEFEAGHIEGAINVELGAEFRAAVEEFSREAPIVVYSDGDISTLEASNTLVEMGFKDVNELLGGYESWVNRPVEDE